MAELDMTNSSHQCPSGLMERTDSGKRTCVRSESSGGCSSINFITPGVEYSNVCGRVIGYQYGTPEALVVVLVLTLIMWMVLASLMETQDSISGHLL